MLYSCISFGFPNPKKASKSVGEDDLRSHLHSQDSQGIFMILVLWRQYSYREVFSLSLSQLESEIVVTDGRDTLSCLHQILLPFLFALSSEVISAAWRLLPFLVALLLDSGWSLDASVWVIPATAKWCFSFKWYCKLQSKILFVGRSCFSSHSIPHSHSSKPFF